MLAACGSEGPCAPAAGGAESVMGGTTRRRGGASGGRRAAVLLLAAFALPVGVLGATSAGSAAPSRAWGVGGSSTKQQQGQRGSSSSKTVVQEPAAAPSTEQQQKGGAGLGFTGEDARMYDYVKACNPDVAPIPALSHPPALHQAGPTRVIPFDLSKEIGVDYQATSPNLLASYIRIKPGEKLRTSATATSQAFYVIRGSGVTRSAEHGDVTYSQGDLFVVPHTKGDIEHEASEDLALYWVNDEPLLKYLGVAPNECKFKPTVFRRQDMIKYVEELRHDDGASHKNRLGILLGNKETEHNTKTLTHTLWSLLNLLPARTAQPPHRHNSVALDLCVSASGEGKVYTLMGPELDENGWVKDPIRLDWKSGGTFVTPPGWWHSHHNEGDEDAWVLPLQDAGLYTHMRSLDIRFSKATKDAETKEERRIE